MKDFLFKVTLLSLTDSKYWLPASFYNLQKKIPNLFFSTFARTRRGEKITRDTKKKNKNKC